MREVQAGAPVTHEVVRSFETCVQCRGCEPACPSGVPYGRLIEQTRSTLASAGEMTPWWQRIGLEAVTHPRLLRTGTTAVSLVTRIPSIARRLGLPTGIGDTGPEIEATGDDAWLFTGCVMDVWQRDVHRAAQTVLAAAGIGVRPTSAIAPCCGSLHSHAGLTDRARELAESTVGALSVDDRPVLVDSAGCGAAMKEYGHLVGTGEAAAFADRVFDVHEWLVEHLDAMPAVEPLGLRVAVQDPCHLRHVQGVHGATRDVLAPFVDELIELDDDGLCCGAGGAYSVVERDMAERIRDRKVLAIADVRPDVVASANPGCALHLQAAGVPVAHPMELVAAAMAGGDRAERMGRAWRGDS
jgi:glycolate oxidase iron-sulfur subunit